MLFHHHTLADKEECLEDFLPVQKQRTGRQRAQNPFSPFSLCNYTDKAWRIGFFSPFEMQTEMVLKQSKEIERNVLLLLFRLFFCFFF